MLRLFLPKSMKNQPCLPPTRKPFRNPPNKKVPVQGTIRQSGGDDGSRTRVQTGISNGEPQFLRRQGKRREDTDEALLLRSFLVSPDLGKEARPGSLFEKIRRTEEASSPLIVQGNSVVPEVRD